MAINRYKVTWRGPYDAPSRPDRVLTMRAKNLKEAKRLHSGRFPCKTLTIQPLGRAQWQ